MFEEVLAVAVRERFERGFEAVPEIVDGAFLGGSEERFELGEGHLACAALSGRSD